MQVQPGRTPHSRGGTGARAVRAPPVALGRTLNYPAEANGIVVAGSVGIFETVPTPSPPFMSQFEVHYDCQRCTQCCRWPGWVPVGGDEIARMACLLGVTESDFIDRYTRLAPRRDGLALVEKSNGECVFLEGDDCRVQSAKPIQCMGFPNTWNFPGWRAVCEAVPRLRRGDSEFGVTGIPEGQVAHE